MLLSSGTKLVCSQSLLLMTFKLSIGVMVTFDPVFYNVSEAAGEVVFRVVKEGESIVSVNVTFSTMDNSALGSIREL